MKQVLSISLLLAFLLPYTVKVWIIVDFTIHRDFIAAKFCVNKNRPMSTCNGKCYLSMQLEKAEEQEDKELPLQSQQKIETPLFYCSLPAFDLSALKTDLLNHLPDQSTFYLSPFPEGIFRPPKAHRA